MISAGLLFGLGCTQHRETIVNKDAVPPNAKIVKAEDLPKRTPKAETSVNIGNMRLLAAVDGSAQGAEREWSLEDARKYYNQALKTDPKCMEAYSGLAQVELNCSNYEGAMACYRKGLAVDAKQAPLWYEMGICQARHRDWPAAQDSLSKACDLQPDNHIFVKTLAFCQAKNGRLEDSLANFKRIMDEGQAHYNLARLLHHESQDDLSRLHLHMALQANPKLTAAQDFLARLDGHPPTPASADVAAAPASNADVGPNVGLDIDDVANELSQTPPSAN
jgi:tetratricopeptide (TPR) repeat protein